MSSTALASVLSLPLLIGSAYAADQAANAPAPEQVAQGEAGGAGAGGSGGATGPNPGQATAGRANSGQLEEITVTARFTRENVQQTPISITALTGDQMEQRGFSNITDIAKDAPNVSLQADNGAFGKTAAAFIRGIGQIDFNFAYNPGVGFYIDDVYYGTLFGNQFDLTDIDRVEVLRGPQGTLFGKNNEGGAIRIFTPEAKGDNSGYVEAGYGSYNRELFRGAFDVAIVPNQLFMRISAGSSTSDGYMDILDYACQHPGQAGSLKPQTTSPDCKLGTLGGDDTQIARMDMRWIASDQLQVRIGADLLDDRGESSANKTLLLLPSYLGTYNGLLNYNNNVLIPRGYPAADWRFITPSPYTTYATFRDPLNGLSFPTTSPNLSYGFSGTVDFDTPWGIHLKNVAAYRRFDAEFGAVSGGTPYALDSVDQIIDHHQFSEEFQLSGKLLDGALEWVAGAYYYAGFSENAGTVDLAGLQIVPPGVLPFALGGAYGLLFNTNDPVEDHDTSGFVHFLYHATDEFSIEAGLRYTDEDKTYTFSRILTATNPPNPIFDFRAFNPSFPYLNGFYPDPSSTSETKRFDPRIAFNYQVTPELLTYFSVATGFKGGGINPRPVTINQVLPFKAEDLTAFELGEKSQWFGNKLRFNADVFFSNYKDLQLTVVPPGGGATLVANAGHVLIDGFEAEVQAEPIAGLLFNGSAGYINYRTVALGPAAYDAVTNPGGITEGTKPAFIPKWKYNVGVQYGLDMGDYGIVTPRLDWTYQSTVVFQNNFSGAPPLAVQPGYGLLSAHVTYDSPDGNWEAALQVSNITDQVYYLNKFNLLTSYGLMDGTPGLPRTFMFTLKRSFGGAAPATAAYAPPPAAPAAAPPPAPAAKAPEAQREFQVFFDFDKSNITEAAARVIQAAADVIKAGGVAHITVTGHTDTVGTAAYNQALSERRAAAVKRQLVADGVGAGEITTVGVGKTGLLVPTADGVREPQNRRAVIQLQ